MKNITLSAPEDLIEQARKKAATNGTTLNSEFREWLQSQVSNGEEQALKYRQMMDRFKYVNAGRKYTREELNER